MSTISLNNANIYINQQLSKGNILIKSGRISALSDTPFQEGKIINCNGKWILPGAIDPHVHFRTPGMEHKETWETGSIAAAVGGVTTVLDMPNTNPPTTTKEYLEEKRNIAKRDSIINFGFHFGASQNNLSELETIDGVASIKIYLGSTTGNLLLTQKSYLTEVFKLTKIPLTFHAENEELILQNKKKYEAEFSHPISRDEELDPSIHSLIRSDEVARSSVEMVLNLAQGYNITLYFCHVSTQEEVKLIQQHKSKLSVFIEASPHHLFLNNELYDSLKNFAKVNPSLRSETNRSYLYTAMVNGQIDTIGTDHAPHLKEEKDRPYKIAPAGLPGVETYIPILLTEVIEDRMPIHRLVELCSENPANIFNIRDKGKIEPGYDADLIIVNPKARSVIHGAGLKTKVKWTPFEGKKVCGDIETTIVNGNIVYHANELYKIPAKEIKYRH